MFGTCPRKDGPPEFANWRRAGRKFGFTSGLATDSIWESLSGGFCVLFFFLLSVPRTPSIIFLRNVQKENGNRPADLEELKRLSKCQAVSCCTVDRLGMQLRRGLWFDFLAAFLRCFRRVFAELAGFRIYRFLFEFLVVSVIRDNTRNYRGHMPKISSVEEMS